jgi:nicotinamidase-related amidase
VLLTAKNSALLLVDLQERLMPAIADGGLVLGRAERLAEAATLLGVPVLVTEQYPKGLGPTVPELAGFASATLEKTTFCATRAPGWDGLLPPGTREVVIAGAEAHVCVLQTALALLGSRVRVVLAADAIGSRDPADKALAVERARQHGTEIVSSEMVLFEWLRDAGHPEFRAVHKLLR